LQRHFKKYFKNISFDDLRKFGYERESRRLKSKYRNTQECQNELLKYSRYSRPSTTEQFIEGKVQKAGKVKKKDRPWEIIIKKIEGLPNLSEASRNSNVYEIAKTINDSIKEKDVKKSLTAMLDFYKRELNIK
jgi:hypothetical protein